MTPGTFDFTVYRGTAFGPLLIKVKDSTGAPVNLTGWQVFSQSRNNTGQNIDLLPSITDAVNGQVTIQYTYLQTLNFRSGEQPYDLLFRHSNGQIMGPFLTGTVHVKDKVTKAT